MLLIPRSVPPQKDVFWPTSMTCMCPAATCEASLETSSGEFSWDRSSPAADSWLSVQFAFHGKCTAIFAALPLWAQSSCPSSVQQCGAGTRAVLGRCCSCPGGAVAGICSCSARQHSEGVGQGGGSGAAQLWVFPRLHFSGFRGADLL